MDTSAALLTVAAGLGMGAINNVAGGAGILGLWAFQYACGLPLPLANPSSRPGAVGVGLFALLGYLRAGLRPDRRVLGLALFAVPGAFAGNLLALRAPDLWFRSYLAVVLLLLLWRQLRPPPGRQQQPPRWLLPLGCMLVGLHMGFAQVGTGFVAALVLVNAYEADLLRTNVAKSVVVIAASLASLLGFLLAPLLLPAQRPVIVWGPALCLALGTACGSFLASKWSVQRGNAAIRRVLLLIGALSLAEQLVQIARLLLA